MDEAEGDGRRVRTRYGRTTRLTTPAGRVGVFHNRMQKSLKSGSFPLLLLNNLLQVECSPGFNWIESIKQMSPVSRW